ncbi:hypothetical protein KC726_00400 [Candidatus Woesebacteria bacterium]|nr:hypothetical protein [Candidatus Woesebacteria bacterium]
MMCVIWFVVVIVFIKHTLLRSVLGIVTILTICSTVRSYVHETPTIRPISKIASIISQFDESRRISPEKKIAVVAALTSDTSVPQADDYRYFLRMKGYNVLDTQQYIDADVLLMFVEADNFDWRRWSSWEIEQAKGDTVLFETTIDDIKIIGFEK